MIAAFDANVLASALIRSAPAAPPAAIWDIWLTDKPFTLAVSLSVLTEVESTLRKPYFTARLSPGEIATFLDRLRSQALMAPIAIQVTGVATHAEDDLILAGAVSANADYLVTGGPQASGPRRLPRGNHPQPPPLPGRAYETGGYHSPDP